MTTTSTGCGLDAYTCSYTNCATHVHQSHRPMSTEEAHAIIRATFGAEAERIIARSLGIIEVA